MRKDPSYAIHVNSLFMLALRVPPSDPSVRPAPPSSLNQPPLWTPLSPSIEGPPGMPSPLSNLSAPASVHRSTLSAVPDKNPLGLVVSSVY